MGSPLALVFHQGSAGRCVQSGQRGPLAVPRCTPAGPLNVVTIDIIFHKCKPVGGRRFNLPHYVKVLIALEVVP